MAIQKSPISRRVRPERGKIQETRPQSRRALDFQGSTWSLVMAASFPQLCQCSTQPWTPEGNGQCCCDVRQFIS